MARLYNYELNENFFRNITNQAKVPLKQVFLDFARGFVFHHLGANAHNFELVMPDPKEYIADLDCLIKFTISRKVEKVKTTKTEIKHFNFLRDFKFNHVIDICYTFFCV